MTRPSTPTTYQGADGWVFVQEHGDTRGINEAMGLRTRLKRETREPARSGLDWAKHDVRIGRLQERVGGEWVDRIDRGGKW